MLSIIVMLTIVLIIIAKHYYCNDNSSVNYVSVKLENPSMNFDLFDFSTVN